jgi:hypothetical protein
MSSPTGEHRALGGGRCVCGLQWPHGACRPHTDGPARLATAHDAMVRGVRMGHLCAVHQHDEWVPINSHHVWPLGMGGPDEPANRVNVCMNGHGQIHAYMDLLIKHGDPVPWDLAKHFGHAVRTYAMTGWDRAGRPRRGSS